MGFAAVHESQSGTTQKISAAQQLRPLSWGTTDAPNALVPCLDVIREEVSPIYISTRNRTHNPDISAVPSLPNSAVRGGANPRGCKVSSRNRRSLTHVPSPRHLSAGLQRA